MENQDNFSAFDNTTQQPPNHLVLAIVGTVLGICSPCCIGLIVGIIAIVFSTQVNSKFNAGDYPGAASSAKNARLLAYIAIGLGVLGIILNMIMVAIMGTDGYMEMIENYQHQFGQ